jgi:hypothetical protein
MRALKRRLSDVVYRQMIRDAKNVATERPYDVVRRPDAAVD